MLPYESNEPELKSVFQAEGHHPVFKAECKNPDINAECQNIEINAEAWPFQAMPKEKW